MTPLDLARLCERSYRGLTWSAHGTEALLEVDAARRTAGLALRGTEADFGDLASDLRAIPTRAPRLGFVHRGFWSGVKDIWRVIERPLLDLDAPLWVAGHSKGGAEATLIAALLVLAGRPPAGLVTFGSPRVGFGLGPILEAVPVRRYVHGLDAVPSHPWPVWGYRHVGDAIRLDGGRPGEDPDRIKDHAIAAYVRAIDNGGSSETG